MCSITAGLMAAGAVMGAYGQHESAKSQAAAARAQADAAEQNARMENKKQEMIADKFAQDDQRRRAQQRLAEGRNAANAGAAGISADAGTSVWDIMNSSQQEYQQDKAISLSNQRTENWISRVNQNNYLNQASGLRAEADNIKKSANIGIASTILGTAAAISGNVGGNSGNKTQSQWTGTSPVMRNSSGKVLNTFNGSKVNRSLWNLRSK